MVQWIMHPWERDARLVHEAISKGPQAYGLLIEIACTRSLEELLGARKAYQCLFDQSIEDVASRLEGIERKVRSTSVRLSHQMNDIQSMNIVFI